MKLQKLTIHNIASIEDAVIDFDAEPLANSEVFLITGKTGAGKSTILDAICLALYADTPRLYNTKMQGATYDANKEVKIDDPRQLLRRNTAEAFVSLTFIGSNAINYEATWSVARSYKKLSGSIKNKSWQLTNLDTQKVLTKDIDIKAEIKEAIGLDFNQFCRTTLLAQGEFTRFLNSKDDEKAEILEKITGVDIYSKIGAKVFELTSQRKQEWENAQQVIKSIPSLSEEEIKDKNAAIIVLEEKSSELRQSTGKLDEKRQWLKSETDLKKRVDEATEELHLANETVNCEEFKQKEILIKDWNATIEARGFLTEMKKAKSDAANAEQTLDELKGEFANLLGGQLWLEQEKKRIEDELTSIDAYIENEKEKIPVYEKAQTLAGYLTALSDCRQTIQKSQDKINKDSKTLEEALKPAFEEAKQAVDSAQKVIEGKENEIKQSEEEVAQLNLPNLRSQRDDIKDLLNKIKTAKERIETFRQEKIRKENIRTRLDSKQNILKQKIKSSSDLDSPIHDAKLKMDVCKENFDKQKDTIDKFAKTLRSKLHIGEMCPVCLQKVETELPHEEELSALVLGLQKAYDDAEKEYKKLNDTKIKLEAEIKSETQSYNQEKKAYDEDDSVILAEKKANKACVECGLEKMESSSLSSLESLEVNKLSAKGDLDTQIKEGEKMESFVKTKRSELDSLRKKINLLIQKAQKEETLLNECKNKIATAQVLINTKSEEARSATEKVQKSIIPCKWEIDWNTSPNTFAQKLLTSAKAYHEMTQKRQTGISLLDNTKIIYKSVAKTVDAILHLMPTWNNVSHSAVSKASDLLSWANEINSKVATAITKKGDAEEKYNNNKGSLDAFFAKHITLDMERLAFLGGYSLNMIQNEKLLLDKERENVIAKNTLLASATLQYEKHQQKKPQLAEDETLETLDNRLTEIDKELTEIGEKKGAINQELKNDAENKQKLGTLLEKAEEKEALYLKWSRLNQLIGNATGSTFRKIAQSYILTSLVHAANHYMKTLTDRYTLKVNPGTFVISLEDAYQGFASRATSTISGGESFLVSLSLALALSDIGQQWQVDTLFIDEGFGTLSGEPLQKAIETLRSLHSKSGRHVGIISHVEELQERIPVQIQVKQEGNSSSSQIVIKH